MGYRALITLVLLSLLAAPAPAVADPIEPVEVTVYYFHGDQRCTTCLKMEDMTVWAVQSAFQDLLDEGGLGMEVVNFHAQGNEHFKADFELRHQSVILVAKRNEDTLRWKNLERIWDLVHEAEAYETYIVEETKGFLAAALADQE